MTRPLVIVAGVGAIAFGFGLSAWILRYEFRHQLRERRHGGYVKIGGQR